MVESLQWLYPWLKVSHILLAIVAVGFNLSYAILIRRATAEPEHLGHVLRTVKLLDDRFANPAYGLLFVVGLAMVFIGFPEFTDLWILLAIGLYLLLVILGFAVYSPILRRQIAAVESAGPDSDEYREIAGRGTRVGALLGAIVFVIIALMVLKPTLPA
ncbi:MAG TPA: DUF2269 family protein [Candidatus Limnocylindria bacterium]|jgi:uncharacterized membrane protein